MREIPLTQGKVVLVDEEDFAWLAQFKWYASKRKHTWYAMRNIRKPDGRRTATTMHAVMMNVGPGLEVDHENGDGLDNRRSNLRVATKDQNQQNVRCKSNNTSGFKGISWDRNARKWGARLEVSKRRIYLGLFEDAEDAARAYDAAALEHHGEFARLNFPC